MCQNPKALTVLLPGPFLGLFMQLAVLRKVMHCCSSWHLVAFQTNQLAYCLLQKQRIPYAQDPPLWFTPLHMQAPLGAPHCLEGFGDWCNNTDTLVTPFAATSKVLCLWLKSPMPSVSIYGTVTGLLISLYGCFIGSFPASNSPHNIRLIEVGQNPNTL